MSIPMPSPLERRHTASLRRQNRAGRIAAKQFPELDTEPHETDCTWKIDGEECADRGLPFELMCRGCAFYWKNVAEMHSKTPQEYINEYPKFRDFEDFASYRWPSKRPDDCTNLDRVGDDCFDNGTHEGDYCASCMEYDRRIDAWDFDKNQPEPNWWTLINLD